MSEKGKSNHTVTLCGCGWLELSPYFADSSRFAFPLDLRQWKKRKEKEKKGKRCPAWQADNRGRSLRVMRMSTSGWKRQI